MREELLEMLGVIHYQLVYNGFMQFYRRELVGIALNYHTRHGGEVLRDGGGAILHNVVVFGMDLM